MLTTVDEIIMQAEITEIFHCAAEVERWPAILPHYRWVTVREQTAEGPVVEMAARRGWIPVRWVAQQILCPDAYEIHYRHIDGPTRGMSVVWRLQPARDGVRVSIIHELTLDKPVMRSFIGKMIAGSFFVKPIAERTLACMKAVLEAQTPERLAS